MTSGLYKITALIFMVLVLYSAINTVKTSPVYAQTTADNVISTLDAWRSHSFERQVRHLYEYFNIVLVKGQSEHWDKSDIASIRKGLESLPRPMVEQALTAPVFIERRAQPCLLGMGRYNRTCPTFNNTRNRFYLYDIPPLLSDKPAPALQVLTVDELHDLQRQRAIAHLITAKFDSRYNLSQNRPWRSINGWPKGNGEPLNKDLWGYSRFLGRHSAHLDFVTFAEEFFIRPENILQSSQSSTAKERLLTLDPDQLFQCQQFTKKRFLENTLHQIFPQWHAPHKEFVNNCPDFEGWANIQNLAGIDILLASATSDRPESLYGHLLLHLRYKSDSIVASEGFEPVYQFGAVTDTNIGMLDYFGRGLLGGFYSVLEANTFRGVDRIFLQFEQRTLRRFGLNLTQQQSLHLLQRIWEAERTIKYPYFFFSKNCASFLLDLIEPALDIDFPERKRFIVMPTDVLDILANINNGARGSLLIKRPEDILSNRETARDAVQKRRVALRKFILAANPNETQINRLHQLNNTLDSHDPARRKKAYEQLQDLLQTILQTFSTINASRHNEQSNEYPERIAIDYLYHSTRIERYFMEVAFYQTRLVHSRTLQKPVHYSADELLDMRREIFRYETHQQRQQARNDFAVAGDQRLQSSARRDLNEDEQKIIDDEILHRQTFFAVLEAQSTIIENFAHDWDGVAYLTEQSQRFHDELKRRDELSIKPSGKSRLAVGWYKDQHPTSFGHLELSYDFIKDRLGELRRRGYRADIESQALSLKLEVPLLKRDAHKEAFAEFILFRYMSIEQKLGPARTSWRDIFGWHTDIRMRHDNRRGLFFGAEATASYNLPLFTAHHGATHLVVGAGPQLRMDIADTNHFMAGLQFYLQAQLHLFGHYANVLRVDLQHNQLGELYGSLHRDFQADLSAEFLLFYLGQNPFLIKPHTGYFQTTMQYKPQLNNYSTWKTGIRFELPF